MKLQELVQQFIERIRAGEAPHLLLTGFPGIGKSHIGIGIYRTAASILGTIQATWHNLPSFCDAIKASYDGGPSPWEDIAGATRLVIIDDLFGREFTPHEKDHVVTRLLDTAYQNHAAVVATMNPPHTELAARLPAHEISRLLAKAQIVPMTSTRDWRR
jgi:DNA replication protein DnaC